MNVNTVIGFKKEDTKQIFQIELLSKTEAKYWRDLVWINEQHWTPRGLTYNASKPLFFTLGKAIYLDVGQSDNSNLTYYQAIKESNELIINVFGSLLEKVRLKLQTHFGEPFIFANKLASPGFHIFFSDGITSASRSAPHVDMQYLRVNWDKKWDSGKSLSFTLPLTLPFYGGGLEVWPELYDIDTKGDKTNVHSTQSYIEQYSVGSMCIQQGMLKHRIAATIMSLPDDERITMQGHALRFNGTWVLYW